MDCAITICCRRKRRDPRPLPAIERYLSRRISRVARVARSTRRPLLILSGRYGLLRPGDRIPWYNHRLADAGVAALAERVEWQLRNYGVTAVTFYARPRSAAGWRPYFRVLEVACQRSGIPIAVERLGAEYL